MHALALGVTVLTLVTTNTPIYAVAQDGPRLAWIAPISRELPDQNGTFAGVYTRLLPGGRVYRVTKTMAFPFSQQLVVAGDRLAWDQFEGGITNTSWIEFAAARRGVSVPAATPEYHMEHDPIEGAEVGLLIGHGSFLGFTVASWERTPPDCGDEEHMCTDSAAGPTIAYAVRGRRIVPLDDVSAFMPAPQHALDVHVPAGAAVYSTAKGAVVVEGKRVYATTTGGHHLELVTTIRGRAQAHFSVAGPRIAWSETLDDHHGRIRAIVFSR
jgi:hypothetical protein